MLHRVVVCLVAVFILVMVNTSCSKRGSIEDQIEMIRGFSPGPMPADTLEVDSLRKTGFR